jgi:hypothetical protein
MRRGFIFVSAKKIIEAYACQVCSVGFFANESIPLLPAGNQCYSLRHAVFKFSFLPLLKAEAMNYVAI